MIGVLSGPSALHVWVMVSGCLTWKLSYGLVVDAGNLAPPRATETCNSRVLRDSGGARLPPPTVLLRLACRAQSAGALVAGLAYRFCSSGQSSFRVGVQG